MEDCSAGGSLNSANYTSPLPWIGLYVAAASTACVIAMAMDLVHAFWNRKFWFPTKYFSINATSLTVITAAIKFSVDLNTPMPSRVDQLSKLSSGVLVCVAIANSMPSLGTVKNKEVMMNVIAFTIMVLTVLVNVAIQLGTRVIYICWEEHAVVMSLMAAMLMILVGSGLAVPKMKTELEVKYRKRYELALREGTTTKDMRKTPEELKDDLRKFWIMAHSSDPQFVLGRSATCTASGALCLLCDIVLAEAMLRSFLVMQVCSGESDYKWSTSLVLVSQTVGVVVGSVAPAIRWFHFCRRRKSKSRYFKVEKYWIQYLVEIKECPFIHIKSEYLRRLAHRVKSRMLDACIGVQIAIVTGCKLIQFISIFFVGRTVKKLNNSDRNNSSIDLSQFVLHLEGEEELVEVTMRKSSNATDHWMQRGKTRQPKHLTDLLGNATLGFEGLRELEFENSVSVEGELPPPRCCCWSLPIVTLTAIAVALPNVSSRAVKDLLNGVHEGLVYVNLVEDNQEDSRQDLATTTKARIAAHRVWSSVDIYNKWYNIDLRNLSVKSQSTRKVLQELAEAGKSMLADCRKKKNRNTLKWNAKRIAANSMYRVSSTILLRKCHTNNNNEADSGERMFGAVAAMISDVLAACLTNLRPVIFCKCLKSTIEERKVKVREAVYLLGETEEIVKLLDQSSISIVYPDKVTNIDSWLSLQTQ